MIVLAMRLSLIAVGALIDAYVAGAIQVSLDDIVEFEAGRRPAARRCRRSADTAMVSVSEAAIHAETSRPKRGDRRDRSR